MKIFNFSKHTTPEKDLLVSSEWLNVDNNPTFTKATIETTIEDLDDDSSLSLLTPKQTSNAWSVAMNVTTTDFIDNDLSYWMDQDDDCKDNLRSSGFFIKNNSLDREDSENRSRASSIAGMTLDPNLRKKKELAKTTKTMLLP